MKKAKLFLTGTAIVAIVGVSMAANHKFGGGSIYCFPNGQTVTTHEQCPGQPNARSVDYIVATGTGVPCLSTETPYENVPSTSCTNVASQTFVSTLP